MAVKPTEVTDWATAGDGSGGASALRTPTDPNRWTLGWQTLPGNEPNEIGERPNLNQQNYWQFAVHKWIQYLDTQIDANFNSVVPLGGIIAVASNLTGAFDSASGIVTNGFQLCDGVAIPGGNAVTGSVPELSDDRFLMGATTAGLTGGNVGNSLSLSHTHDMLHIHSVYWADNNGDDWHFFDNPAEAITRSTGSTFRQRTLTSSTVGGTSAGFLRTVPSGTFNGDLYSGNSVDGTASQKANTGSGLTGSTDILPQYLTVKYFMRVN
jgi:hypothetical protein